MQSSHKPFSITLPGVLLRLVMGAWSRLRRGWLMAVTALTVLGGQPARAANRTWDGSSVNNGENTGWSYENNNQTNWAGDVLPIAGDALFFGGNVTQNTNDYAANTNFAGITFNSGAAAFTLGGNAITLGGDVTNNSANLQTIGLNLSLSATRIFNAASGNLSVSGAISGGGFGLTKTGAGSLTLSNTNNSYTGTLAINAGILSVASLADSGAGSNGIGAIRMGSGTNTAEMIYTGSGTELTRQINLAGSSGGAKITNNSATGTLDFTNANFFSAVAAGAKTLTLQGSNGGTISGVIANGGGNVRLTKAGGGTWTLTGSNTYSGATTISEGTLQIGNGGETGSLSTNSIIVNNSTLAFNRSNTLTQGSDFNSNITGTGGVIQKGSGTTIFTGSNDYEGTTTVSAGTLRVNGSINGTGGVNVASGAILGGIGYIAGAVNVSGTLAPGDGSGIGTLTFGQTLDLAHIAQFEIDPNLGLGLNTDLASVVGNLSYGGTLNVVALHSNFADGMRFKLFDAAAYYGTFATVNLPVLTGGLSWQNDLATTGTLTVIPEPPAALIGTVGLLMLLRRRRGKHA